MYIQCILNIYTINMYKIYINNIIEYAESTFVLCLRFVRYE